MSVSLVGPTLACSKYSLWLHDTKALLHGFIVQKRSINYEEKKNIYHFNTILKIM